MRSTGRFETSVCHLKQVENMLDFKQVYNLGNIKSGIMPLKRVGTSYWM
jgi:hypothetical protein